MSMIKKEIFIASRFEEFREIRSKLSEKMSQFAFIEPIDLNDNKASHRSPLAESLFHVRKSEVMLLLVGESYGTIPEGEAKSYTHLEYQEAIKESSNTRVLVFCIGAPYAGKFIEYSNDTNMKAWQIELEKNHRLSKFSNEINTDSIVEQIMIMLLSSLYDLNPLSELDFAQDEELYIEIINDDEDGFLKNEEVSFLDNLQADVEGVEIVNTSDDQTEGFELLKIPGKLASLEQKKEAQLAIEIQDYYTAIKHLRKALDLRPLDFESNYWLAKLYVLSAKKSLFYEIEEYLLRAAKIAQAENSVFKASHCYQLIIEAAIFSDKESEGIKYIELAEELTPNFARLYYQKAKFMFYFGYLDKAKISLNQAINIKMDILKDVSKDPFFMQYSSTITEIKNELKSHLHKSCYAITSQTNSIKQIFGLNTSTIDLNELSIYELWNKARYGFILQYQILSGYIQKTDVEDIINLENEITGIQINATESKNLCLNEKDNRIRSATYEVETNNEVLVKNFNKNSAKRIENLEKQKKEIQQSTDQQVELYNKWMLAIGVLIGVFILSYKFFSINTSSTIIFTVLIISFVILFLNRKKIMENLTDNLSKLKNNFEEESFSLQSILKKAQEEEEFKLKNELMFYEEDYIDQINEIESSSVAEILHCNEEIKKLHTDYENISKAFDYFESNTVNKSTSKFVPFKSLKSAKYGSIIRITPQSYTKYIEAGKILNILNDFPEHFNIPAIDPEHNSFLGKVIQKNHNSMVISRFKAYAEK